jgi:hypothetical protein
MGEDGVSGPSQLAERKRLIRIALIKRALERQTIYYADLGQAVGMPAQGPWKDILDEIAKEETSQGRPDFTYLVISKQTGLPGQIGFEPAKPPTPVQRKMADDEIQKIFAYYRL